MRTAYPGHCCAECGVMGQQSTALSHAEAALLRSNGPHAFQQLLIFDVGYRHARDVSARLCLFSPHYICRSTVESGLYRAGTRRAINGACRRWGNLRRCDLVLPVGTRMALGGVQLVHYQTNLLQVNYNRDTWSLCPAATELQAYNAQNAAVHCPK